MKNHSAASIDFSSIRDRLQFRHQEAQLRFSKKHEGAFKYFKERGYSLSKLRTHSTKVLSAGSLAGALLLSSPQPIRNLPSPAELVEQIRAPRVGAVIPIQESFINSLKNILPDHVRPLENSEEKLLENVISQVIGVKSKATLEGEHLNQTYGLIGAEQHLYRYPGDTVSAHGTGSILNEGIAPGLGAWGYFANSKEKLTPDLANTEKWYAVVQTLYLPQWNTRFKYLRDWYKYRKVLIVNTNNGNAVIAAIADSGPAAWTGKHFGGSPEVMEFLGGPRYKKGPVVLFFVDDPNNQVSLGPVEYNKINLPGIALTEI